MTAPQSKWIEVNLPVMLVDDEAEILKSLARDLRRHAIVETFTSPKEALEAFRHRDFAVVVSDLQMPEMNGLEFLTECEKIRPECQRMLLTAFADLAGLEDSVNRARINRLMTKPWEAKDLQDALSALQRTNEAHRENIELRRLALMDGLTGVANHRYFWDRLEAELSRAKRYGRPLSLIMCDVDDFKKYNDEHGHRRGDEVLRDVAQTLEKGKRLTDLVARYGGEEFAIILPEVTRPAATEFAKREIEHVFRGTQIGLSMGVASYPDDAKSTTELVETADRALLLAKKLGKKRAASALELPKAE